MFCFCRDRKEVYMGDDNYLTLTFNAKNDGGGAYEAELYVVLPPEADYSGIARNNEVRYGDPPSLQVLPITRTCARPRPLTPTCVQHFSWERPLFCYFDTPEMTCFLLMETCDEKSCSEAKK